MLSLEAAEWGKYGRKMLALACSPDGALSSGASAGAPEEQNLNEVRALLAASKLLACDPQVCASVASEDSVLLAALSSRLCTAPDRAVKAAAAAAMAAILAAAEQHAGGGASALREHSAATAALGELVQDHGLQALEAMLNKSTGT